MLVYVGISLFAQQKGMNLSQKNKDNKGLVVTPFQYLDSAAVAYVFCVTVCHEWLSSLCKAQSFSLLMWRLYSCVNTILSTMYY